MFAASQRVARKRGRRVSALAAALVATLSFASTGCYSPRPAVSPWLLSRLISAPNGIDPTTPVADEPKALVPDKPTDSNKDPLAPAEESNETTAIPPPRRLPPSDETPIDLPVPAAPAPTSPLDAAPSSSGGDAALENSSAHFPILPPHEDSASPGSEETEQSTVSPWTVRKPAVDCGVAGAALAAPWCGIGNGIPDPTCTGRFDACLGTNEMPESPLSLEVAVATSLRNNPQVSIARQRINRARGGELVAFAPFLPNATSHVEWVSAETSRQGPTTELFKQAIGYGPGQQDFMLAEVHASWTIYAFGRRSAELHKAELLETIACQQYRRTLQTISFETTMKFLRVARDEALLVVAEAAVERANSILFIAKNRLKRGVIEPNDLLLVEVQVANSKQLLVQAQTNLAISRAALGREMGLNPSLPFVIVRSEGEPPIAQSVPELLEMAIQFREEFAVAQNAIGVSQSDRKVTQTRFLPTFNVHGTAAQVEGDGIIVGHTYIGGVYGVIDIFDGGKKFGMLRQANADLQISVQQARQICLDISFQVIEAYQSILNAAERIKLARVSVDSATANLAVMESRYKNGSVTPTDVVVSDTALTTALKSLEDSIYDYMTAVARLQYAVGRGLVEDLPFPCGNDASIGALTPWWHPTREP